MARRVFGSASPPSATDARVVVESGWLIQLVNAVEELAEAGMHAESDPGPFAAALAQVRQVYSAFWQQAEPA